MASMQESYKHLKDQLQNFESLIAKLKLRLKQNGSLDTQIKIVNEFLNDLDTSKEEDVLSKWVGKRFGEFYSSSIAIDRISRSVLDLAKKMPEDRLKKPLKNIIDGDISQDFVPDSAKDFFFELELGAALANAGFNVELLEPDIIIQGNGLSGPIGLACKYPSSLKTLHDHISKGYRQLSKASVDGLVVIGMDLLLFDKTNPYQDFRQEADPLSVFQSALKLKMIELVAERLRDYPSEKPIDGCMLTLSAYGAWGNPPGMLQINAAQLQCEQANPRYSDYSIIAASINEMKNL